MTVTYPHDRLPEGVHPQELREEPIIPVYARDRRTTRGRKGGIKTWMILAPIGVLVLGAGVAAMIMGGGDDVSPAPLVEPAATAPVLPPQPLTSETAAVEPAVAAPIVEAAPAPAPVARRTAPVTVRRTAPTKAAPTSTPAPAPAPAARVEAPAEPTASRPYTATLNAAPTPAATPAPAPAPVIVIQPAD